MQRSKLQFYSIISSAHFRVSNTSTSLGPQMTKWLSLGGRCAARHPTSVVTCFFFARLLWIIGAQYLVIEPLSQSDRANSNSCFSD
jgi:hypothetical protein